jgi:hypothetical protein
MARIITRELAEKIRDKLCTVNMTKPNSVHDVWGISHNDKIVGIVSIRRGSEKDKGHDYIPKAINVSTGFAKQIGICNKNLDDYLRQVRLIPPLPESQESALPEKPSRYFRRE